MCRFDVLWRKHVDNTDDARRDQLHYFRGVRTMLRDQGYAAFHGNVPWAGSVEERAAAMHSDVLHVLQETGADKIHIIAHSMGGLDARHMLFADREAGRIHERVASLTTISTPHEGSPFADWGFANFKALMPVAARLGLDVRALEDLTTRAQISVQGCSRLFSRVGKDTPRRGFAPAGDATAGLKANQHDFDAIGNQTGSVVARGAYTSPSRTTYSLSRCFMTWAVRAFSM